MPEFDPEFYVLFSEEHAEIFKQKYDQEVSCMSVFLYDEILQASSVMSGYY